jgi:hypothetical protein
MMMARELSGGPGMIGKIQPMRLANATIHPRIMNTMVNAKSLTC